ncbi:MAG: TRAM domain-containing protein [Nanoarchaeota archaeon]|nr:TRAM domain-containing protein [Nanoarchaeota archaeon]
MAIIINSHPSNFKIGDKAKVRITDATKHYLVGEKVE